MSAPLPAPPGAPYRSVGPARTLAPPPRHVPGHLRTLLYFGSASARMGWLFVAFGTVMCWIFGMQADWSPLTVHGPYDHLDAQVVRSHVTLTGKHHDQKLTRVTFRYTVDDTVHEGVSYHDGEGPLVGATVTIEVPHGRFDQAVVVGMRRAETPFWALLILAIFPLLGLGFAGHRVRAGRREVRLLTVGLLGHGKLVHRELTNVTVNKRPVEKLSFDFEDRRGRVHRAVVRTLEPDKLTDDALEPLVYDPLDPSRAALLDALPGTPRVDAAGQLAFDGSPWTLFAALALPVLAVVANLAAPFVAFVLT